MAGGAADQATWRALLAAGYFNLPEGQCKTCTPRSCANFFCMQCKVGGVCEAAFQEGGNHVGHPHIRVWLVTRALAVYHVDLRRFMADALVDQVQLYFANKRLNCKFFKPNAQNAAAAESSKRRVCRGCNCPISVTTTPNLSDTPVCSLECLLNHAQAQQQRPRPRPRKQSEACIVRSDYAEYRPQR